MVMNSGPLNLLSDALPTKLPRVANMTNLPITFAEIYE